MKCSFRLVGLLPFLLSLCSVALPSGLALAADPLPRIEWGECPIEVPDEPLIECGTLVVPADYDQPEGSTHQLALVIIRSQDSDPAPDPVLYTEGGPGFSSLSAVQWLARSQLVDRRDVVLLEQRGNRYAEPALLCDVSVWWQETDGNPECLEKLQKEGVDLSQFSTDLTVRDIQSLRQLLDYDEWNLYGSSYSTKLMLLTMQRYPEGIRSVMLRSVLPPGVVRFNHDPDNAIRAFNRLFDDCTADPDCAAAYPELETHLYSLVRQLNQSPAEFDIILPDKNVRFHDSVDGYRLLNWMASDAFYSPARPPFRAAYFPLLVDRVYQGETNLLRAWLVDQMDDLLGGRHWAWGVYFAINCQEGAPQASLESMTARSAIFPEYDGYLRSANEKMICQAWNLPSTRLITPPPLQSEIPTLIMAGSYDSTTPPAWGRLVADSLSKSTFVEFPSAGHNILTDNACAEDLLLAFVDQPDRPLDTGCVANVPGPSFVLPDNVISIPSMYELFYWEVGYSPLEETLFEACLYIGIVELAFLVMAGLMWLLRRLRNVRVEDRRLLTIAHALAGAIALLNLGYTLVWRSITRELNRTERIVLRFGLPTGNEWLLSGLLLSAVLSIVLLALTVQVWRRRDGWSISRLILTVATLGMLLFTGLSAYWGLLTALL